GGVTSPFGAVPEDGDAADVRVDVLGDVDVDVAEEREHMHGRHRSVDPRVAQVEIYVGEDAERERVLAKAQPTAADDVREHPGGDAGRLARRAGRGRSGGQVLAETHELLAGARLVGGADPLAELLERQPPGEQVVAELGDCLLTLRVGCPQRRVVHCAGRYTGPASAWASSR